ncbi:MAG: hypothetical protein QXJ31_05900 [Candidatus Bathyarchaeia archaeon]
MLIEVFVRSASPSVDIGFYREMSQHMYCGPEMVNWAYRDLESKFKGRILQQEDYMVLEKALRIVKGTNDVLLVYDVSHLTDKLKALKKGVKKTPTVIIDGRKYEDAAEILKVLEVIPSKVNQ